MVIEKLIESSTSDSLSVSMYFLLFAGALVLPFEIVFAVADFFGTTFGAGGGAFLEDFLDLFGISSSSTALACLFTTKPDFLFLSDAFFFAFSAELGAAARPGLLFGWLLADFLLCWDESESDELSEPLDEEELESEEELDDEDEAEEAEFLVLGGIFLIFSSPPALD